MQFSKSDYDPVISFLKSHSAEEIPHVDGNLLTHLVGTCKLLADWGNPTQLCLAGLCHAVYGTYKFEVSILNLSQRSEVESVIGQQAEEIVYFYASCDRSHLYPQIGYSSRVQFRDRFSGEVFVPDSALFKAFLELTFANELESARRTPRFAELTRAFIEPLFGRWDGLVSDAAFSHFVNIYSEPS